MPVKTAEKPHAEKPLPGETPQSAGIGHNRPPPDEEARASFREELLRDRPDFEKKVDDIEAAAERVVITDDDSFGRAGDFIKMCRLASRHVDDAHKTAKRPYLDAGRAIDEAKNGINARINVAQLKAQKLANEYAAKKAADEKAERERLEAEAQAAAASSAMAEQGEVAPLAAAPAKKPAPIRSDGGATVSTTTVWNSHVEDYRKAFTAVKSDPKVQQAIDAAISRLVKAGQREIKGVKIWDTQQAVAR